MALLDTHAIIEEMIAAGVKKKQAEIITRAINGSKDELVTKGDLELGMIKLKVEILKWIVPMFLTNILFIIGLWLK
jgi:hypothetical protein